MSLPKRKTVVEKKGERPVLQEKTLVEALEQKPPFSHGQP